MKLKDAKAKIFITPLIVAFCVFVLMFLAIIIPYHENRETIIWVFCWVYGAVCLGFLCFQLYAFVQSHMNYNESIENIKYKVFAAEDIPLHKVKMDYEI